MFDSMVEANMNALRIWGGGDYGTDEFYSLADEKVLCVLYFNFCPCFP